MEEISWGENVFVSPRYSTWTIGFPPWSITLNGHVSISFLTVASSYRRPIKRLVDDQYLFIRLERYLALTWHRRLCSPGSSQLDSLQPHRSIAPRMWRRRMKGWWSFPARWRLDRISLVPFYLIFLATYWSQHWFPHNWRRKNRSCLDMSAGFSISPSNDHTKIDANGTIIHFVAHDSGFVDVIIVGLKMSPFSQRKSWSFGENIISQTHHANIF